MNSKSILLFSQNPNSLEAKLTNGLLRALLRINNQTHQPKSTTEIYKRQRLIKAAAFRSMTSSVGNRRAWSRALLSKIRNPIRGARRSGFRRRRRRMCVEKRSEKRVEIGGGGGLGQVEKLRRLVPGGEVMDTCSLLEETADYMRCLATQVKVMSQIVEIFSVDNNNPIEK